VEDEMLQALYRGVENEPYAKKLKLKLVTIREGYSVVEMTFSQDMKNMFGLAHGGAIFSLIDEAFEVAANSHGVVSLALSMNVSHARAPADGDTLRAEAKEISLSKRIGTYYIQVKNGKNELIATCQALVYRTNKRFPLTDQP